MAKFKIIHWGDSLTECPNINVANRWTEICRRKALESVGGGKLEVLNRSLSGRNTRQALEVMQQEVQFEKPDLLTIQYGANDSVRWKSNSGVAIVSAAAFRANLHEMIDRANAAGIKQIFFHTNHKCLKDAVEANGKGRNENLEEYNQIIREVARQRETGLVDLYEKLLKYDPRVYVQPMPDGVHLNEKGCELYADFILDAVYSGLLKGKLYV